MSSVRSRKTPGNRAATDPSQGTTAARPSAIPVASASMTRLASACDIPAIASSSSTSNKDDSQDRPSAAPSAKRQPSSRALQREFLDTPATDTAHAPSSSRPLSRPSSREVLPRSSSLIATRKRSASGNERRLPPCILGLPSSATSAGLGAAASSKRPASSSSGRQSASRSAAPSAWTASRSMHTRVEPPATSAPVPHAPSTSNRSQRGPVDPLRPRPSGNLLDAPGPSSAAQSHPAGRKRSPSSSKASPAAGATPMQIAPRSGRPHRASVGGDASHDSAAAFVPRSFTRSRMSIGDDDDDDDDDDIAVDLDLDDDDDDEGDTDGESTDAAWMSSKSMVSSVSTYPSSTPGDGELAWDGLKGSRRKPSTSSSSALSFRDRLDRPPARQSTLTDSRHVHGDLSIQSQETDWDEELGITEVRQGAGSLLRPTVFASSLSQAGPSSAAEQVAAAPHVAARTEGKRSDPQDLHHSPQIRGLRVTQSVSESWDDDFLFQNDDDAGLDAEPAHQAAHAGKGRAGASGRSSDRSRGSNTARKQSAAARGASAVRSGSADAESEEDENWDVAFSWEDVPERRASMRRSTSPQGAGRSAFPTALRSTPLTAAAVSVHAATGLPPTRSAFRGSHGKVGPSDVQGHGAHARAESTSSRGSVVTDLSAALAAQSDASSWGNRSSSESGQTDLTADLLSSPSDKLQVPLAASPTSARVVRPRQVSQGTIVHTSIEDSGDETETEADSSVAHASPKGGKSKRRSLLASFTRGRAVRDLSPARRPESSSSGYGHAHGEAVKTLVGMTANLEIAGPGLSPKGRFYKLDAFGSSRTSVVDASDDARLTSSHRSGHASLEPWMNQGDHSGSGGTTANPSLTSLNSQSSQRSRRSFGASVPSKLERGYRALKNAKIGRRTSQKPTTPSYGAARSPPSSPLARSRTMSNDPGDLSLDSKTSQPSAEPVPTAAGTASSARYSSAHHRPPAGKLSADFGFEQSPHSSDAAVTAARCTTATRPSHGAGQRADASRRSTPSGSRGEAFTFHDAGVQLRSVGDSNSPAGSPARARRDHSSSATLRASASAEAEVVRSISSRDRSRFDVGARPSASTDVGVDRHALAPAVQGGKELDPHGGIARSSEWSSASDALVGRAGADPRYNSSPPPNSRSVSASTETSACSSDALSRTHRKDASWSGTEMYDSETTHGTSVGSDSPSGARASDRMLASKPSTPSEHGASKSPGVRSRAATPSDSVRPGSRHSTTSASTPVRSIARAGRKSHNEAGCKRAVVHEEDEEEEDHERTAAATALGRAKTQAEADADDAVSSAAGGAAPSTTPSMPLPSTSAQAGKEEPAKRPTMGRRNSLSDLRIPSRISRAQTGIRANITLVRDFAKGVEELKALQAQHDRLRRALSSADPVSRHRIDEIEQQFQNWWDCADVLVGLGQGRSDADASADVRTISHSPAGNGAIAAHSSAAQIARERRITLDGPASRRTSLASQAPRLDPIPTSQQSSLSRPPSGAGGRKERQAEGLKSRTSSTSSRNVNPQREIDIIAAMLNAASIAPDSPPPPPPPPPPPTIWERSSSTPDTKTMSAIADGEAGHSSQDGDAGLGLGAVDRAPPSPRERPGNMASTPDGGLLQDPTASRPSTASLSFADASPPPRKAGASTAASAYPYNTAPAAAGSRGSLFGAVSTDSIAIVDGNKSAKRRLRSASRAGLQGLKELLKAFRSNAHDDDAQDRASAAEREEAPPAKGFASFRKSFDASAAAPAVDKDPAPVETDGDRRAAGGAASKRSSFGWMEPRADKASISPPPSARTPVGSPERRRSHLFRRKKDGEAPSADAGVPPSSPPLPSDSPRSQRHHPGGPASPVLPSLPSVELADSRSSQTSASRPTTASGASDGHRKSSHLSAKDAGLAS
ncbi:uncharacterized protein PFL1_02627 [Pseudozyma flocculosa PF-1]|uniref:Uncharacterized protein n=1 Tax=Pseudozyma flocculosa PF-1 TaxID=1277687 RepID=A0A061HD36_9BASI|nr:uncharacterized protein PFL1_02627 [Pseudozyma flocculosa PF-1]EPQ29955.1 hypothetical protein PFL1_02627 [Pseudozyma flocculosa PF-1]